MKYLLLTACLLVAFQTQAQQKGKTKEPPDIFTYIEQMPAPGYDMGAYLGQNMTYPDSARKHNIEGRVLIRFVVNEDGRVSDAKVMRGIGYGCDEEALGVVEKMPRWIPGKQNDKPVKVYFNLPIVFKLED